MVIEYILNQKRLFDGDGEKKIAALMNSKGELDFFGDPMTEDHGIALTKYFKEHEINDATDENHFLPHVYSKEEASSKLFKNNNSNQDFNQYLYANYLIKVATDMGYIFIKNYTSFNPAVPQAVIFIPSDMNKMTVEQREALKDINYVAHNKRINISTVSYKDYKSAVNDAADSHNLNEIIYQEEESYVQAK